MKPSIAVAQIVRSQCANSARDLLPVEGYPCRTPTKWPFADWHTSCHPPVERDMNCVMPVLSKLHGIIIRMLVDRTFGIHLHAFYGDCEMVVGLNPVRVIQGEVPSWVEQWVLDWIRRHTAELAILAQRHPQSLPSPCYP
jgi:hypothetical protein